MKRIVIILGIFACVGSAMAVPSLVVKPLVGDRKSTRLNSSHAT